MAKFNQKATNPNRTTNVHGAEAFNYPAKDELYARVLTSMMGEKKFYETAAQADNRLVSLTREVAKTDPEFVAGLAIVARKKFYLRSVPQVLMVELADVHKGDHIVQSAIRAYMQRPDEMTELLSYFSQRFSNPQARAKLRKIPNQIKKGLADVFTKFDEYQLQKYNRPGAIKLRDVLFLVHPCPKNTEQAEVWKKLIDDKLATPSTWETQLSVDGQTGRSKQDSWTDIAPKMPIMALLKNMRNFAENRVDPQLFADKFTNPVIISKSKLLPFRFMSAYRELQKAGAPSKYIDLVVDAMDLSIVNLPQMPGRTLVASDNSGSMTSSISSESTVNFMDIANLFGAMINKKYADSIVGVFGNIWKPVGISKRDSVLASKMVLDSTHVGHSTNLWAIFDWAMTNNEEFDRIVILSDMQAWDSGAHSHSVQEYYNKYCQQIGRSIPVYTINLNGYSTIALDPNQPQVHKLAGWSEKVIEYIAACEIDKNVVYNEIYAAIRSARSGNQ